MNLQTSESLCRPTPARTSGLERRARSSNTWDESSAQRSVSAAAARRSPRLLPGTPERAEQDPDTHYSTDLTVYRELIVMLISFWEYLRRRTAESVLLGIQDAIAATERPSTEAPAGEFVVSLEISAAPQHAGQVPKLTASEPTSPNGDSPRRRGRPRKHPATP
jgi:hypothetical protein